MLTAASMEIVNIIVLKEKSEEVALRLLETGVFHPVDSRSIEDAIGYLKSCNIDTEYSQLEELETKSRGIIRQLGMQVFLSKEIKPFSYSEIGNVLNSMEAKLFPAIMKKEEIETEIKTKENLLLQLKNFPQIALKRDAVYSFLEVSAGMIEEKNISVLEKGLKDIPHIIYPFKKESNRISALLIGLKRDRVYLRKVLGDLSWQKIEYPKEEEGVYREAGEKLTFQIGQLRAHLQEANVQIVRIGEDARDALKDIQSFIILKKSLLETKRYSCLTEKAILISGWVPSDEREKVFSEVKNVDSSAYIEAMHADEMNIPKEEVPVKFEHGPLFKPFELLISSYGIPRYGTIDPTIFVAISFLLMFGAMFGDIGHGLVLALGGLFLRRSKNDKIKQAGTLLAYCGISGGVFGFLYGSFFGIEFPSVWIKPMDEVLKIFKITIGFGIGVMTVGILINIINAIRDKDYLKVFFDKAGLIGGVIYWSAIGVISKMFISNTSIPPLYAWIILLGVLFLFLKPFIEAVMKKEKLNMFTAFIESLVDLLEIGMSYLANTISFIRIAAFSLAHIGLFFAIFELSRIVNKGYFGPLVSFLIVIIGNMIIIMLEGLVVGIQSLRLNYYEFFSKFFITGKKEYTPVNIDKMMAK